MSSSHDEAVKDMRNVCGVCKEDIKTMTYMGTGICSVECQRVADKENPPEKPLTVTLSEVTQILDSAGVAKKHQKAVADGWNEILAKKMPHLFRVVDAGDTKDVK